VPHPQVARRRGELELDVKRSGGWSAAITMTAVAAAIAGTTTLERLIFESLRRCPHHEAVSDDNDPVRADTAPRDAERLIPR
jgi:hypothetical protein